jgi:hypothetical protein
MIKTEGLTQILSWFMTLTAPFGSETERANAGKNGGHGALRLSPSGLDPSRGEHALGGDGVWRTNRERWVMSRACGTLDLSWSFIRPGRPGAAGGSSSRTEKLGTDYP